MDTTIDADTLQEDQVLMEEVVQRKAYALEKLFRRYRAILKSVIMQVLHDDTDADDVLQDVFIQVWDRASNYSAKKGKLISWLATMARRRAIDRVRQHTAYRRATDRYEIACNHPDKDLREIHTVEHAAQSGDLKEIMQRHLQALPPPQRQAIHLNFFEGRSQREISSLTGIPLGTVKTRIELGIKKLNHAISGLREQML